MLQMFYNLLVEWVTNIFEMHFHGKHFLFFITFIIFQICLNKIQSVEKYSPSRLNND